LRGGSRITIVNRYFWPEVVLANDIAVWLAEAGYEVDVIASQPSYNPEANLGKYPICETWNGLRILRVPLLSEKNRGPIRHLNNLLFILVAATLLLFGASRRAVWATSIPPVLQPLLLRIVTALRGSRFVYFVQDIYPEIAILMQMVTNGSFARSIVWFDNWTLKKADAVVSLSDDMTEAILARGVVPQRLTRINNFSSASASGLKPPRITAGPCRFVFAGNIGRYQNLERVVDLFADIDPSEATLDFLGEGRIKALLEETVTKRDIKSISFHHFLPAAEAFAFVQGCDVGIVSLVPGLYAYAYPSKTFTYLAAGLPLLCFIERHSELARDLEARKVGVTIDWSSSKEELLLGIRRMIVSHREMSEQVREKAQDLYDRERARSKWIQLFSNVLADEP
jgi:glycosyltransferase involved in cell wall biosynthesis